MRLETILALVEGWVDEVVARRPPSRSRPRAAPGGGTSSPRRRRPRRAYVRRPRGHRAAPATAARGGGTLGGGAPPAGQGGPRRGLGPPRPAADRRRTSMTRRRSAKTARGGRAQRRGLRQGDRRAVRLQTSRTATRTRGRLTLDNEVQDVARVTLHADALDGLAHWAAPSAQQEQAAPGLRHPSRGAPRRRLARVLPRSRHRRRPLAQPRPAPGAAEAALVRRGRWFHFGGHLEHGDPTARRRPAGGPPGVRAPTAAARPRPGGPVLAPRRVPRPAPERPPPRRAFPGTRRAPDALPRGERGVARPPLVAGRRAPHRRPGHGRADPAAPCSADPGLPARRRSRRPAARSLLGALSHAGGSMPCAHPLEEGLGALEARVGRPRARTLLRPGSIRWASSWSST